MSAIQLKPGIVLFPYLSNLRVIPDLRLGKLTMCGLFKKGMF